MSIYPKDHIAYTGQQAVSDLCRPIMEKLNLSYYHHTILNKDGTGSALLSRTDWLDHFYRQNFKFRARVPNGDLSIGQANFSLWEEANNNSGSMGERVIQDARNLFNIQQPISIVFPYEDHFENFVFACDTANYAPVSTYLSNLNTIMQFIQKFREEAAPLIQIARDSAVTIKKSIQASELELLQQASESPKIFMGLSGQAELSEAEFKVIQRVNLGMTAPEIADQLFRSKRTIETHIDNIKGKLGCKKRSELARIINKHQDLLLKFAL